VSKITLNNVADLINTTTAETVINANSAIVQAAFDNTLSLDGTSPNQMATNLDMNSKQILNLPAPATNNSPLRLQDLTSFTGGGTITNLPTGGLTGDALIKNSNTNYDVVWSSNPSDDVAGLNIVLTGTNPVTIATVTNPTFSARVITPAINNGGDLALPTSADTLVARNTTDTLTNKTFVAPVLGAATATSINKVAITAPASSATITIPDGTTLTGPAVSGTAMTLGNTEIVTGVKTFGSAGAVGRFKLAGTTSGTTVVDATAVASGTLTLPAATDTLVGKATTDTLTNKTFNSTGTGNVMQVSGVTVSSGQYPGEPTTGNATAGNVGEFVSQTVLVGAAVSLTNGVAANITSISLTAGDWDVSGNVDFLPAGTTTVNSVSAWTSITSATFPTSPNAGALNRIQAPFTTGVDQVLPVGVQRISVSGTTTVFLSALAGFSVSTMQGYGFLRARRVR